MIEPLSQRTSPYNENGDLGSLGLPTAPPPLPPRSGLRSLRVLPSPEDAQVSEGGTNGTAKLAAAGALQLRNELEAARNELNALQDMLEELPAILERKFQQRLRGLLDQQRVLIARNESLRERLLALTPSPQPTSLPQGAPTGLALGFRRSLQRALGLPGSV